MQQNNQMDQNSADWSVANALHFRYVTGVRLGVAFVTAPTQVCNKSTYREQINCPYL